MLPPKREITPESADRALAYLRETAQGQEIWDVVCKAIYDRWSMLEARSKNVQHNTERDYVAFAAAKLECEALAMLPTAYKQFVDQSLGKDKILNDNPKS